MLVVQYILEVTAFEKEHFDSNSIEIVPHSINIQKVLGFGLDDLASKELSGAPRSSTITIVHKPKWSRHELVHEKVPPGLYFLVKNPEYLSEDNVVGLFADGRSDHVGIYMTLIAFKRTAPRKVAARMLARIVRGLELPGITRINLWAAGGRRWSPIDKQTNDRWGGYVAWPTYGFDMPLLKSTKDIGKKFPYWPKNITECQAVSDVLRIPGGREYWRVVGDGWYMSFDLSSNSSYSIETLNAVLKKEWCDGVLSATLLNLKWNIRQRFVTFGTLFDCPRRNVLGRLLHVNRKSARGNTLYSPRSDNVGSVSALA